MNKKIILILLMFFTFNLNIKADIRDDSLMNISELNSNNNTSDNGISPVFFILLAFIFALIIIVFVFYQLNREKKQEKIKNSLFKNKLPELSEEKIHFIDNDLNVKEFCKYVYNQFIEIQKAISEFNEEKLKECMSDELYNISSMLLKNLKEKKQRNIMSDFINVNTYINNIEKEDNFEKVDLILVFICKSYTIDQDNNIVIGQDKKTYEMTYMISYIRNSDSDKWLMNSKKLINQRLEEEAKFYDK